MISECKYSNILCSFQLFFCFCANFSLFFVRKRQNKVFLVEFSSIKMILSSILSDLSANSSRQLNPEELLCVSCRDLFHFFNWKPK